MRIALIVPENNFMSEENSKRHEWDNLWEFKARKRLWSTPNLSLLTIAGMLPRDIEIEYIDMNFHGSVEQVYDWVFFSPSTSQIVNAYHIADQLRIKGSKIAMGGVHVSILPDEALEHSDVVFIGEAEEIMLDFLKDIEQNDIKKIYKGSHAPLLSYTPIPRYDLGKKYPYKSIPVQTSRGCPHQCSFCVSSKLYGKKIRRKSVQQIQEELYEIKRLYDKPFVFFTDDNLFINEEYSRSIIEVIGKLNIRWYAFTDASIANKPDLLKSISEAGCSQLLIGFESLSLENLESINSSNWKAGKLKEYKDIVGRIQGHGIGVVGSFVLGLECDSLNVFDDILEFVDETCLYATNITILTPFPGTEIFERLEKEDRITTYDWSKYNGFELTFMPRDFTVQQFEEGYKKFYQTLNSAERATKVLNFFKAVIKKKNNW
ncbi:MAG: B12-binding domain-containing radical SAM protein [Bacillota bacterium]